jgi:membrane-associated phospholipid phosphatase
MLATTLGITAFFVAYFWVLHHPQSPLTTMPLTALDRALDFRPEALPLYLSLWLYVSLAPALLKSGRELSAYGLATLALSVVGLCIFILWPTTIPASDIDWAKHPSVAFLKSVDVASNACPSLHVAFAVFTALWLERLLLEMRTGVGLRVLNLLWCLGILYSTIAIRQHVVLDVVAGALLGGLVAALHMRALR